MKTFISAPFGNYIKPKNCISVTGTWTFQPRGNPGILVGTKKTKEHEIISVAQVEDGDFKKLFNNIWSHQNVEINLSCPNILEAGTWSDAKMFLNGSRDWCIAKVSPLISLEEIEYLIDDLGFTQIHFSNTLPLSTFNRFSGNTLPVDSYMCCSRWFFCHHPI